MTHTTNIHLHAGDVVSTRELTSCDTVEINDAISVFVIESNAAVILQLSQVLRAAALKHGATEDERAEVSDARVECLQQLAEEGTS